MRSRLLVPTALAVLALAACSGSEPEPTASPSSAAPSPTAEASEPATEPGPSTESPEPAETSDASGGGSGGPACLEGTWLLTAEEVESSFTEMIGGDGAVEISGISVSGDSTITFEGSTLRQEWPSQRWSIAAAAADTPVEFVVELEGTVVGDIEVGEGEFTVTETDVSEFSSTTKVLVDGQELDGLPGIDIDEIIGETGRGLPEGHGEYSCSGDSMTLTVREESSGELVLSYDLTRR